MLTLLFLQAARDSDAGEACSDGAEQRRKVYFNTQKIAKDVSNLR